MQIQKVMSLVDKLKAKLVVLLCHHNADPDAVCAAFAFSRLLKYSKPELKIEIAAAQGPSRLSRSLLNSIPAKLITQPHIEEADILVMLDTNTIQQLDEWGERVKVSSAPLVVIDHHASHSETERLATLCITDEQASSTCEIVFRFYKETKTKMKEDEAKALLLGIAFDTRHFILASSSTLKTVAELVDAGVNAREALSLLSLPMDYPERIARLKASRRVRLMKIQEWLIGLSYVSAYQASAARALIGLGVHIAVVVGQKGKRVQASMRASRDFYNKTGVHLGRNIAKPLGECLKGMGGGHSVSAGANGVGDVETTLKRCVRLLKKSIASRR